MSRSSRLKDLNDELRRLFDQNINEGDAYNQVKDEDRFDTVRLTKVTAIFKQFRSKPKRKEQIDPNVAELLRRTKQPSYFQSIVECNHEKMFCLKFWNGNSSDGRFFVIIDRVPIINSESNSDLKDVFSKKTCRIKIPIDPTVGGGGFSSLTKDTGLLIKRTGYDDQKTFSAFSLSFLEFDWIDREIRKTHTLSFEEHQRRFEFQRITHDTMNSTRFLLQNWYNDDSFTLQLVRVNNDELLIEEEILTTEQDIGIGICSLVGNTLYTFNSSDFAASIEACIYVTRLDQGAQTSRVNVDPLPEQFTAVNGEGTLVGRFAMDRLYLAVQDKRTKIYGIIWTSCETRNWELSSFFTKNSIVCINFMIDGHLLLIQVIDNEIKFTSGVHQNQKTFYRIPLKKSEKLTRLAWFSLVRSKSKIRDVDPYEEARKYLPFNSDIQCPFED